MRLLPFLISLSLFASATSIAAREDAEQDSSRGVEIVPYIEAQQVVSMQLSPGDDVVTWTQLAAGVDAGISGRNSEASVSLRYERVIGYGEIADSDTITGIARGSVAVVPRTLTFEAGALATRTEVDGLGASTPGLFATNASSSSQLYSVYAGPTLQAAVGRMALTSAYRIGYTRVESPDITVAEPDSRRDDLFDESVSHSFAARAGFAPGEVLPAGVGIGVGWNRQDISNFDQRIDEKYVRADVTFPVSPTVAIVGGVGAERVEVSSRDVLRDGEGAPVIGADGQYTLDTGKPRQIAYETEGLIWDVGVMWRPSRRTSLEAYVGHRYGATTYHGTFGYAPSANSSFNLSVYHNITSFGGVLADALADLSTNFTAFRNPVSGDLTGCVTSLEGGNCALARLGPVRSSVFRNRGITASYGRKMGRTSLGLGAGYDRREYIAPDDSVLSAANGVIDQNYWVTAGASRQLDRQSGLSLSATATWLDSGFVDEDGSFGYSASLGYYRDLLVGLSATAAIGLDGITRDSLPDYTNASALAGLRYTFR